MYTNKAARFMAHNLVYIAGVLKRDPIPIRRVDLIGQAPADSDDE